MAGRGNTTVQGIRDGRQHTQTAGCTQNTNTHTRAHMLEWASKVGEVHAQAAGGTQNTDTHTHTHA